MIISFALFKYFPYGGLQRNFLNIAKSCHERGHEVHAYVGQWEGDLPEWLNCHQLGLHGLSNHARARNFSRSLTAALLSRQTDVVVGFNRLPGLDVYYAADPCFAQKSYEDHGRWFRWTARYRTYAAYEKAVYGKGSSTQILAVSEAQVPHFRKWYETPEERFHVLPPGISRDRMAGENAASLRAGLRSHLGIRDDEHVLLMVGSGFRTKGVDRAVTMLAQLPASMRQRTYLVVVGSDDPAPYKKIATQVGVDGRVIFFDGRDDIPSFLQAADGLVHPAYHENTGNVLLEAVIAGLPVLATDVCGYAPYILRADAGLVHESPFEVSRFARQVEELLVSPRRAEWRQNGIAFGQREDLYHRADFAAAVIERAGGQGDS